MCRRFKGGVQLRRRFACRWNTAACIKPNNWHTLVHHQWPDKLSATVGGSWEIPAEMKVSWAMELFLVRKGLPNDPDPQKWRDVTSCQKQDLSRATMCVCACDLLMTKGNLLLSKTMLSCPLWATQNDTWREASFSTSQTPLLVS